MRHGIKDPKQRTPKAEVMVVKGPAGGFSNSTVN